MAINIYGATALTGGGTGALDAIDGDGLNDTDIAIVSLALDSTLSYTLDDDSGAAESSPAIISPDSNAGNKRWILNGFKLGGKELILDLDGDTSITADTDDQIDFRCAGADQVSIDDGAVSPATDDDVDLGKSDKQFKDLYIDGKAYIDQLGEALDCDSKAMTNVNIDSGAVDGVTIGANAAPTVTDLGSVATCDINGGTIDGAVIGGAAAAAVTCTTLATGGKATFGANEAEGSNFDINGGAIDGCTLGANSANTYSDLSVGASELDTSIQSQSQAIGVGASHEFTLTGGLYCFLPRYKVAAGGVNLDQVSVSSHDATIDTSYSGPYVFWDMDASSSGTAYVQHRYMNTSSNTFWYFIIRDRQTKEILGDSAAPHHPCFNTGCTVNQLPHPWHLNGFYNPDLHEIIVINPSMDQLKEIRMAARQDRKNRDNDLLEALQRHFFIDELREPEVFSGKTPLGFAEDVETGKLIAKLGKVSLPSYVVCKGLRKR